MSDEVLNFGSAFKPIELNYAKGLSYSKCKEYDLRAVNTGYKWHQIIVEHGGKFNSKPNPKKFILDGLFEAVENEEFYPVAYRRGATEDKFLVRNCNEALDKLFSKCLRIELTSKDSIELTVQLNIAVYVFGQVSPQTLLSRTVNNLMDCMERYGNHTGILNLTNFAENSAFEHISVNLGNTTVLKQVCENIHHNEEHFHSLNGLILRGNNIQTLSPLQILNEVEFVLLDLSDNCITSTKRFGRDVQKLKIMDLCLAGNPILKSSKFLECLKPLKNILKFVDGVPFEKLTKVEVPKEYVKMDTKREGYRIDASNISEIVKYADSEHWHAVVVPDAPLEFAKDLLFDYFFISLSNNLSEVYPCYYKYESGEHRFLVRNCYDQLEYLANTCNLEFKVPRLVDETCNQILFDRGLPCYLRMNISAFKEGQILPKECIDKALSQRFSALDRLLNLEKFQEAEGLEQIIVNLSSTKVLFNVLSIASRKYVCNCTELRLAQNKITSLNYSRSLTLLTNLQAIDLGNNWIPSLKEIKELGLLPLKALRLDGNPLCKNYTLPSDYVKAVREIFPFLVKLDNVDLSSNPALVMHKNYLVDIRGYELVEQFVKHFFRVFESDERACMADLYEPHSLFTMTFHCSGNDIPIQKQKRLSKYRMHAKNNLKLIEHARAANGFHVGDDEIINVFMQLPTMKFDFTSFHIDMVHYDFYHIYTIYVSGVFKDVTVANDEMILAFTSRFILKISEQNVGLLKSGTSFKIINQTFDVVNTVDIQTKIAFKIERSEEKKTNEEVSIEEKERLLVIFQKITGLNSVWCGRCLTDGGWNMKAALDVFFDLNKGNKLRNEYFV